MTQSLSVGLLQAGYVQSLIASDHGDYPELFAALLAPHQINITTTDLQRDGMPDPDSARAWIVSGSANSAYEDLTWIRDLEEFARLVVERGDLVVGICFGHQVLAQAFGGRVEKAEVGWGIGVHQYSLVDPAPSWTGAMPNPVGIVASHQDQVTVLPSGAKTWLTSEFCPNAGYVMGKVMTIQPHPEFTAEFSEALTVARRERIGAEVSDKALASLSRPVHNAEVGKWIANFLRSDHR